VIRALVVGLVLAFAAPMWAQEAPVPCVCRPAVACDCTDPDDDPPPDAAHDAPSVVVAPPAPARKSNVRTIASVAILPGYRRLLDSDWLGTAAEVGIGARGRFGLEILLKLHAFFGATTFSVPFQHLGLSVVFVIPTGTRLHIGLGHSFGYLFVEEAHVYGGRAESLSMGGYLEPSVDLLQHGPGRLSLTGRLAYDFVDARGHDGGNMGTVSVGLTYTF
jgi:hypothetical protein